ncbi:hypothetical protein MRB53_017291 [Persea americana]|uniref:Uncharacterized protein n=1 Tax=Persea americana TaxID=3435 RepID=A0ACC2M4K6_PERAE|nr:hypothetical protein MRB53_017291 [Persea americana]
MEEKSLIRPFISLLISTAIAIRALKRKSLNLSGAFLGFLVMFMHFYVSYRFGALLLVFFFTSSKLTKYGEEKKRIIDADFKEGGQRDWIQVLANSGIATALYACCNGDTWSSELGMLSDAQPRLITTFKPVRKGTNGGVTTTGLVAAAAAGLCGSLIDSVLGATVQFSGFCTIRNKVVGKPGPTVRRISGMSILDNNGVNLVSVCLTTLLTAIACLYLF